MKSVTPVLLALFLGATMLVPQSASAYSEGQELIDEAVITVKKLMAEPDIAPHLQKYVSKAKGVLIFPNLLKAGFLYGAEGGSGVLLTRAANGQWSYPAFFAMGSASFGLQFGGQASETIIIIMSPKGLTSILAHKVKVGAEVNAAVGNLGVGFEASTSTALGVDMITYSISKGAFLGGALEGAIIEPRVTLNHEYYGSTGAATRAILLNGKYGNPKADHLRQTLATLK